MKDPEEPVKLPVKEWQRRRVRWSRVVVVLVLWAIVAAGVIYALLR